MIIFVLEPKVPVYGRQGTLSVCLEKEEGLLPSTTELECPAYNDIFDRCPWVTGDEMAVCWNSENVISSILFDEKNLDLSEANQPIKDYYWFFEYIRSKNKTNSTTIDSDLIKKPPPDNQCRFLFESK